jgi:hypothetical protein
MAIYTMLLPDCILAVLLNVSMSVVTKCYLGLLQVNNTLRMQMSFQWF